MNNIQLVDSVSELLYLNLAHWAIDKIDEFDSFTRDERRERLQNRWHLAIEFLGSNEENIEIAEYYKEDMITNILEKLEVDQV